MTAPAHPASSSKARILDGKRIAEELLDSLKAQVDARMAAGKPRPGLAVVLVGNDPASSVYVRNKRRAAEKVGIRAIDYDLPPDTSDADLLALIDTLADKAFDPSTGMESQETRGLLAAAINSLSEREKIVVTLYYFEGLTLAEIGQDERPGHARRPASRGRRRARRARRRRSPPARWGCPRTRRARGSRGSPPGGGRR